MSLSPKSGNTARKKHIVFVNYYFPPMGGGGVQRITKFLKYFDYEKYDVSVLTVRPSFFYSSDPTLSDEIPRQVRVIKTGSLDPFRLIYLSRKFFRRPPPENLSGESSHPESGGKIRKFAMSVFVPDSRLFWLPFALTGLWRLQRRCKIDLIIASMPPFTAGLIGCLGGKFAGVPVILDFRDAWTNNPYLPGIGRIQGTLSEKLEQYCARRASGLVFVNPALESYYREKYPFIQDRSCATIRNGFDPDDFPEIPSSVPGASGPFTLGIMGTIYSQGNIPFVLFRAVKALKEEDSSFQQKFRLVFLGKWSPDFREWIAKEDLQGLIDFIPYRPHREALSLASSFSALTLAIDSRLPGSSGVTPGRIYEYLYLKKPILALCPLHSDLADLVRDSKAGEVVEFNDVEGTTEILCSWVENRQTLNQQYSFENIEQYSRKKQAKGLLEFIEGIGETIYNN